jgi:hypothetical protein
MQHVGRDVYGDEGNPLKIKSASSLMRVIIDKQLEAFVACDLAYRAADILSWFNQASISFSNKYIPY